MKSFEARLRDDILAANLRPILRSFVLTDEQLMKNVNELASHQPEIQNKLASKRRLDKVNFCKINDAETKTKKSIDSYQQISAGIREIKAEVENLKRQQVTRGKYSAKHIRNESG